MIDDLTDDDAAEQIDPPLPRRHRLRGAIAKLLVRIIWFGIIAFTGLCAFIDIYGHQEWARPAQAIVILGARVEADHQAGDSLRARTLKAVELYRRGIAGKIICTGGLGTYAPTEAQVSANLAHSLGVPESDLLLEMRSTNTEENTRNAAGICRRYGWTQVVAVSDPYHLWRVKRDFSAVGITPYTSPAVTCIRNTRWPLRLEWTAREGLAVTRDVFFSISVAVCRPINP